MGNSAKEKRQYIIINVLLILIVLLLGVYIYKVIQSNKQQIKVGYEQGVNVVQQLQDEYINVEKVETRKTKIQWLFLLMITIKILKNMILHM